MHIWFDVIALFIVPNKSWKNKDFFLLFNSFATYFVYVIKEAIYLTKYLLQNHRVRICLVPFGLWLSKKAKKLTKDIEDSTGLPNQLLLREKLGPRLDAPFKIFEKEF